MYTHIFVDNYKVELYHYIGRETLSYYRFKYNIIVLLVGSSKYFVRKPARITH